MNFSSLILVIAYSTDTDTNVNVNADADADADANANPNTNTNLAMEQPAVAKSLLFSRFSLKLIVANQLLFRSQMMCLTLSWPQVTILALPIIDQMQL